MSLDMVWVFKGSSNPFPSAVFSSQEQAQEWIRTYSLNGTLTAYPLDQGVYDWAVTNKYFTPKKEKHKSPSFIQNFSSGYQEHYHYENGKSLA